VKANWTDPGQSGAFTATLNGLLFGTATAQSDTQFVGHLGAVLNPDGSVQDVALTGDIYDTTPGDTTSSTANLDPHLDLQFGSGQSLPFNLTAHTNLNLSWTFGPGNGNLLAQTPSQPNGQPADSFGTVTAEFDNVTLDPGSLFNGGQGTFVDNVLQEIGQFTTPLAPIASFLGADLPGLSSLGIHVSLASIFGLGDLVNFVNQANAAVSAFSSSEGVNSGAQPLKYDTLVLDQGSYSTVLGALQAGNPATGSSSGGPDLQGDPSQNTPDIAQQASAASPFFQAVEGLNVPASGSGGNSLSVTVGFPIVEETNPQTTPLFQLLEGNAALVEGSNFEPLFKLAADFHVTTSGDLPPVPVSFILVQPSFSIGMDVHLMVGYDATGLQAAGADSNSSNWPAELLGGFVFWTPDTYIQFNAGMTLTANAYIAQVTGTLGGQVQLNLPPDSGSTNERHFDSTLQSNFGGEADCGFGSDLSGSIYIQVGIDIGFDVPFLGHVTLFSFDFPQINLIDFSAECAPPSNPSAPPSTIDVPLDNGDHAIRVHRFTVPAGQNLHITGIEVDDNGHMTARYPTYEYLGDDPSNVVQPYGQVQQIAVYPLEYQALPAPGVIGNDSVVIEQNVSDANQGPVNVLMVGHDGGNDDLEDFASGQAVIVAGKKQQQGGRGTTGVCRGRAAEHRQSR
jgi:hypothetical protein